MTRINILPSLPGLVTYNPDFLPRSEADAFLSQLIGDTPWRQEVITMYGREMPVPRLTSWHGDGDYTYSNIRHTPNAWTPPLGTLQQRAEAEASTRFNSVLLNLYRDGRDSVAWHADDERELGQQPIIASVSLGAEREFKLRHKAGQHKPVSLRLGHGSCLIMGPGLQQDWEHAIPKTTRPVGPRLNLTFRWIG